MDILGLYAIVANVRGISRGVGKLGLMQVQAPISREGGVVVVVGR